MRTYLTLVLVGLFAYGLYAQPTGDQVKKLIQLDGTLANIERVIDQTIETQKESNPHISNKYWDFLRSNVSESAMSDFIRIATPIYQDTYTSDEIDELIKFYSSKAGKQFISKQPDLIRNLNMPLVQWVQNLNADVIKKIESRGKEMPTSNEIESFESEFKSKYGLEILNLSELSIDRENNPGTLCIDFGEIDCSENVTRKIVVRNNTDSLMLFKKPIFLSEEFTFDWGNKPLEPKEVRELKFTLNCEIAENQRYVMARLVTNQADGLTIGLRYKAPTKVLSYSLSADSLKFKEFKGSYSGEYEFIVTNTGGKEFRISDVKLDNSTAFVQFDQTMIGKGEHATIRIIFSKKLGTSGFANLEVLLSKSDEDYSGFPDERFNLKIY